ncbi:response regulator [Dactylosporangium vinaceum]|uniref:Sensor-like histidine kinase SenX3 n=1 Tax=Dactylosporangium vinaceum TaxID=53362 RepID=A0ABV5M478_9ACTN|nr:response regulator [Dactylosporangium vinaceum]UAB93422.1 response regulator [Dactylosporangium vinaceum]
MANTVLIVDDSLTVRMDLHEAFEDDGFRTVLCAGVGEALEAVEAEQFDVAVLDVRLPDGDGVDLLRRLRAHPRHADAVVLLLSTEAEVHERLRGLRTGADDYVGKPYDAPVVVARARDLLRHTPAAQSRRLVLVIDDSRTFREILRQRLAEAGYEVATAGSGEEGLRVAGVRPPDAIIVDGVLPGIDGATVIRRLRLDATLRNVPSLLLTASDDYLTELQILEAGADAFVRKQDDLAVVLAKLAAILRKSAGALPLPPPDAGSTRPARVLLVDSDSRYLESMTGLMHEDGYEAVLAGCADDALAMLAVQPADCTVIDLHLPEIDGLALCDRIRAVPGLADMPVIIVGHDDVLLECLAAGADDYVRRGDGTGGLRAHIRAHLRRQHLHEQNRRIRDELVRRELEAAEERAARRFAETRAQLVEELEWRNRELEAFSGSVSHDLRSPLQTILSYSELLAEDATEEAAGHLRRIHGAAVRMNALIGSLLQLAQANRGQISRRPVDLSALAEDVVEELRQRDPQRTVQVTIAPAMTAACDGELVRAVYTNLVGNAWKFTARASDPAIDIGFDGGAYFVRDNGAGFPADRAEELFRPFGRLHDAAEFPGTGIGLTTVQRIIDRHGGRVWATSEPGRGATFSFTLTAEDRR